MPEQDLSLALDEAVRPPMANGEVLFEEPWQGRVFAMAVGLHESGLFEWHEFQATLIEVVGEWDRSHAEGAAYQYYEHFQAALLRLLDAKRVVSRTQVEHLAGDLAARPHGHDH